MTNVALFQAYQIVGLWQRVDCAQLLENRRLKRAFAMNKLRDDLIIDVTFYRHEMGTE